MGKKTQKRQDQRAGEKGSSATVLNLPSPVTFTTPTFSREDIYYANPNHDADKYMPGWIFNYQDNSPDVSVIGNGNQSLRSALGCLYQQNVFGPWLKTFPWVDLFITPPRMCLMNITSFENSPPRISAFNALEVYAAWMYVVDGAYLASKNLLSKNKNIDPKAKEMFFNAVQQCFDQILRDQNKHRDGAILFYKTALKNLKTSGHPPFDNKILKMIQEHCLRQWFGAIELTFYLIGRLHNRVLAYHNSNGREDLATVGDNYREYTEEIFKGGIGDEMWMCLHQMVNPRVTSYISVFPESDLGESEKEHVKTVREFLVHGFGTATLEEMEALGMTFVRENPGEKRERSEGDEDMQEEEDGEMQEEEAGEQFEVLSQAPDPDPSL